jgi:cell division protein FtsI (penicillin-binding protein 3)
MEPANPGTAQQESPPARAPRGARLRAYFGAGILSLLLLALAGRLVQIQILQHRRFRKLSYQQQTVNRSLAGRRGDICDRTGRLLAVSVQRWSIFADPSVIEEPEATAIILGRTLNVAEKHIERRLRTNRRFAWVKRQVSDSEAERVRRLDLKGVHFRREYHRLYPPVRLFGHVVGFTDIDGRGLSGAEVEFDRLLRSTSGKEKVQRDAIGRVIRRPGDEPLLRPSDGYDIHLTVDAYIQDVARKAVSRQVEKHKPDSAWAVVMNVQTGAVLAMVNWPEFDPNAPADTEPAGRRNRILTDSYEFGSVMKPITVAAALEAGLVETDTEFQCHNGAWRVGYRVVHDVHGYDRLSVADIVVHSSNIGVAQIGLRLGARRFYDSLRRFGFGNPTGINLPGEVSGILRPVDRWNKHSLISVAFGQEIATTPLSVATAFCSIANGGLLLRPRIVHKVVNSETGRVVVEGGQGEVVRRAISSRTAEQVLTIMRRVVTEGTGRRVALEEYPVAGKTGTASLPRRDGRGYSNRYLGSFIGIAPADNPRIVVLVSLKAPTKGSYYGGTVAGPACRTIILKTLQYLNVPETTTETAMAEAR